MLDYWTYAVQAAWNDAWQLIFGGFTIAMVGALIFVLTTVITHVARGKERSIEWVWDGACGALSTAIIGGIAFVAYLFFWIPVQTYRDYTSEKKLTVKLQSEKANIQSDLKDETKRNTNLTDALLKANGQQVDPDEWPPLTESQIQSWYATLAPLHIQSISVLFGPDVDARKFYGSLRVLAARLKCDIRFNEGNAGGHSIVVEVVEGDPCGPIIVKLLSEIGPSELLEDPVDIPKTPFSRRSNASIYIPER